MSITMKTLGGIQLAAPGFGAMGLSHGYGNTKSKADGQDVIREAIKLGYTVIDTADIYKCGTNERLVGSVLSEPGLREKVFLCTKFGFVWDRKTETGAPGELRGDKEYVKSSCDESLQRLGVKYIDLYYQHRVDDKIPIEETVTAMEELRKEGKIKYLGLSECSANTLRKACKVAQIHAVQVEFSPFCLDPLNNGIFDACKELGVAIVCFSPVGRGFLTGTIKSPDQFADDDMRKNLPRFSKENFDANLDIVHKFKDLADKKGCTPGQLCLSWLMAQGDNIIPIPGTTSIKNLRENWDSTKITVIETEMKEIDEVVSAFIPKGDRYAPTMQKLINR